MKKYFCLFLSILMILMPNPIYTSAAIPFDFEANITSRSNSTIVYEDDAIIIECILIIDKYAKNDIQPFSSNQTKTATKRYTARSNSGKIVGIYTLTGTFSYNGKTSSCTKASCSASIKNNNWTFTSKTASKSGNKATGSFSIKHSSNNQTISQTLNITCNKNGTIS